MCEKSVNDILRDVFPNEISSNYITRLTILYRVLLDVVKHEDVERIYNEIIRCENMIKDNTVRSIEEFKDPTDVSLIQAYSELAFACAIVKYNTGNDMLIADYQGEIFEELCKNEDIVSKETRSSMAKVISETILDFKYASGSIENTSFRMHSVML